MKRIVLLLLIPLSFLAYLAMVQPAVPGYIKTDILAALDDHSPYNFFINLESGYHYTSGSRINLFADEDRWAIVFEKSGFGNRSGYAEIELNYYGNCLMNLDLAGSEHQFVANSKVFTLISEEAFGEIEGDFELVAKEASVVTVRNKAVSIEQDNAKYKAKGIDIQDYDNPDHLIDYPSLVRYLDEENPELFRATKDELRTAVPDDLPFLMKIDQWHHKSFSMLGGDKPSSYETFQLIAEVLVSKNVAKWNPTLKPNNDWRNWPEAGGL